MLTELAIRDIVLIEEARLVFRPGLNVLTGETGAGKSILLDALGLALGWKGRADVVRAGAAEGEVQAVFDLAPGHPALAVLDAAGLPLAEELILRRVAGTDGRMRAFVNDRRAGAEVLRALSECLVELHGQQDDRGLLDARGHRAILDSYGGHHEVLTEVRAAWGARTAAERALSDAEIALAEAARDADFLRHAVAELAALDPQPGEEAVLDTRRRLMQGAARIRADVERALAALGSDGAGGRMADALRWLQGAAARAEGLLDAPVAALERAFNELAEAEQGVEAALDALGIDPRALEATEERLFAMRALARKHQVAPDDLPGLAAAMAARLAAVDDGAGGIARLRKAAEAAATAYLAAASRLSADRVQAAAALDAAMAAELPPLKLEAARFVTGITPQDAGPEGADRVVFAVATNPGSPPGPIGRIASGGELSRFLLALKVALAGRGGAGTMIFDEIDRGVGGATADAVGRRLARVATDAQVLAVTHSPQVAARAAHHWLVRKAGGIGAGAAADAQVRTEVVALDAAAREAEIARMLAGETVTDAALAAARALIAG
jgi:DNA repair protein RecN (Recombination protein N)